MTNNLLTAKEAAAITGLAATTIVRWARRGELPAKLVHGYLIDEKDLKKFMLRHPDLSKAGRRK